jgi:hypothetical protein
MNMLLHGIRHADLRNNDDGTLEDPTLRVRPGRLEVADLGYRWGAAMPDGRVRIHWTAMQLQPGLVDYVVAHELAHLHEPHHGPTFWALLSRVMPDYEERKGSLAKVGTRLWMGSVLTSNQPCLESRIPRSSVS